MKTSKNTDQQLQAAARIVDQIIQMLRSEEADAGPDTPQAEYVRGGLWAAKWMTDALLGKAAKHRILDDIRRRTQAPIPHIVGLAKDGHRYGFDSDAG